MPASDRRRSRSRAPFVLKVLLTAALVAAVLVYAAAPPPPQSATPSRPPDGRSVAGAYHIHTTRSDGALDREDVALAASRAGLKFAIFTDHGDATRGPAPPEYLHGVLCVDGVEVSSDDGHYVALGIGASPYPLGGEGEAVAEDVARLGGFGIAAHPSSPRGELEWRDWSVPLDALEWISADSEWRDESRPRLGWALVGYLMQPAGALASLMDLPVATLARWDELAAIRRVVSLPAHDAHGGLGREGGGRPGRRLHLPSYEATFRTFSMRATLSAPLTGDAARDSALLLAAIRQGSVFTVIDAIATPGSLDFRADSSGTTVPMGGTLPEGDAPATFRVQAAVPSSATTVLLRNGQVVAQREGGELEHTMGESGSYRVEIRAAGAPGSPPVPWISSNPIFRFRPAPPPAAVAPTDATATIPLMDGAWRTEISPGSSATVSAGTPPIEFAFRLREAPAASQFVALVRDLRGALDFSAVAFTARAAHPARVSVQLRFASDGGFRWRKSFYADGSGREVRIPVDRMHPADGPGARPPASRATSLLFVVDLTNAAPGTEGTLSLENVRLIQ